MNEQPTTSSYTIPGPYAPLDGSLAATPLLGLASEDELAFEAMLPRVLRALLAYRRETDKLEAVLPSMPGWVSSDDMESLSDLRCEADKLGFDAEVALGLTRDHWNAEENRVAARIGKDWPPAGIDLDMARRLLRIEMDYDLLERALVVCKRREAERTDHDASFGCADDVLPGCLALLAKMRVAELAALEIAS